jgi:hypothetical protein
LFERPDYLIDLDTRGGTGLGERLGPAAAIIYPELLKDSCRAGHFDRQVSNGAGCVD